MNGVGLSALLVGAIMTSGVSSTTAMATTPVVEVVVYRVKDVGDFESVRRQAHALISKKAGFIGSVRLKHVSEADTYADLVVWAGVENAHVAASAVERETEFVQFQNSIASVALFRHYDLRPSDEGLLAKVAQMPVVEIAAHEAREGEAQSARQQKIHAALKEKPGFVEGMPLVAADAPRELLDIIGWTSAEANHNAANTIQAEKEYAPFFEGMQTLHFFGLFKLSE